MSAPFGRPRQTEEDQKKRLSILNIDRRRFAMVDKTQKGEDEDWLGGESPSIGEKNDGKSFGEFEIPRRMQRLKLKKDQAVLIPNHVLYDRVETREIEESDSGSDPEEDELDFMEQADDRTGTRRGYTAELLAGMIDIDGRRIGTESVFDSYEKAADFVLTRAGLQQTELLCRVLFDYHGGYSLLDLDVVGGQKVLVKAEENETFLLGRNNSKWMQNGMPAGFLRGQRYSLVRPRESALTSPLGLIPSFYLVSEAFYKANPCVFADPKWYLGLCSFDQAVDFLLADRRVLTEGLFIVFSPRWLNLNPAEPRPFVLLMLTRRSSRAVKALRKMGENRVLEPKSEQSKRLGEKSDLAQQMTRKELETGDRKKERRPSSKDREPGLEFAALAALPFAVLPFTIKRSYLGDFEFFGQRYPTLYHLVLDLSSNCSELPHNLVVDQLLRSPSFPVVPMDPPLRQFKRSPTALPMQLEQWTTKQFVAVSEPFYHSSLMQYVVRSVVDPARALFARLGMSLAQMKGIRKSKELVKEQTDEHSLQFDAAIVIQPSQIAVGEMIRLGAGNFGQVYKSRITTKKGEKLPVVIKKFPVKQTDPNRMLAFVQEVETVSSICHVNIAKFYGLTTSKFKDEQFLDEAIFPEAAPGADDVVGCVLLIFELCAGKNLQSFLIQKDKNAPSDEGTPVILCTGRLLDFLSQIARALAYLHTRSPAIVHGDVSARNIMVTRHPRDCGRYVLKLIDFGLAKFCRADMNTHYDSEAMPAPWLPRETLKNGELSVTTDVWSFGCVIWEMFGGGTPWGVSSPLHQGIGVAGQYLSKPDSCPNFLYNLLLMCHRPQPHDRITMVGAEQYLLDHWIENEGTYLAEASK